MSNSCNTQRIAISKWVNLLYIQQNLLTKHHKPKCYVQKGSKRITNRPTRCLTLVRSSHCFIIEDRSDGFQSKPNQKIKVTERFAFAARFEQLCSLVWPTPSYNFQLLIESTNSLGSEPSKCSAPGVEPLNWTVGFFFLYFSAFTCQDVQILYCNR